MDSTDSKNSTGPKAEGAPKDWQNRCHTVCETSLGGECPLCRRTWAALFELCKSCPTPCPVRKAPDALVPVPPELPFKIYRDNGHSNVIPLFPRKPKNPTPDPTPTPKGAA